MSGTRKSGLIRYNASSSFLCFVHDCTSPFTSISIRFLQDFRRFLFWSCQRGRSFVCSTPFFPPITYGHVDKTSGTCDLSSSMFAWVSRLIPSLFALPRLITAPIGHSRSIKQSLRYSLCIYFVLQVSILFHWYIPIPVPYRFLVLIEPSHFNSNWSSTHHRFFL